MYTPTLTDLAWATKVLLLLKDGGTLSLPQARLQYKVDKQAKRLTLINVEELFNLQGLTVHLRTRATFKRIGYEIMENIAMLRSMALFDEHQTTCPICQMDLSLCAGGMHLLEQFYRALLDEAAIERRNDGA